MHRGALRKGQPDWGDDYFLERTWGLTMPRVFGDLPLNSAVGTVWTAPMVFLLGPLVGLGWSGLLYFFPTQNILTPGSGGSRRWTACQLQSRLVARRSFGEEPRGRRQPLG